MATCPHLAGVLLRRGETWPAQHSEINGHLVFYWIYLQSIAASSQALFGELTKKLAKLNPASNPLDDRRLEDASFQKEMFRIVRQEAWGNER
jgi:hypothetical protein